MTDADCIICHATGVQQLWCNSCFTNHDGQAIQAQVDVLGNRQLSSSFNATMRLLARGKAPRPETRLKLSLIATRILNERNNWKPRNRLVSEFHQTWKEVDAARGRRPGSSSKAGKTQARRASGNGRAGGRAYRTVQAELEAICEGDLAIAGPEYKGDTGPKPGGRLTRARSGHWTQSKEERDVANFLYRQRLSFVHEYEASLGPGLGVLYPDFLIPAQESPLVKRTLVIEHFGLLGQGKRGYDETARYRMTALRKICDGLGWDLTFTTPEMVSDNGLLRRLEPFIEGMAHNLNA